MKQIIKCDKVYNGYIDTDKPNVKSNYMAVHTMLFKPKEELIKYLNMKYGVKKDE